MSISNNIDGTLGGGNQLLDLLSLVSNPAVYEAKIKSLQKASDEYAKFVSLVGPASEIMDLREKAKVEKEKSAKLLADATSESNDLVKQAKEKSQGIISDAQAKADKLTSEAQKISDDAKSIQEEARRNAEASKKAELEFKKLSENLNSQKALLLEAQKNADAKATEAEEAKIALISKHKAFIESL